MSLSRLDKLAVMKALELWPSLVQLVMRQECPSEIVLASSGLPLPAERVRHASPALMASVRS